GFFVRRAEKVRQAQPRTARARRRRGLGRPRSLALSRRAAAQGGPSLFARRAAHQPDFSQGGMTGFPRPKASQILPKVNATRLGAILARMSRTSSEVFPLDPQIAQRVVLLSGRSQSKRGPRQRTTRDERFRLRQSIFDMGRACAAELLAELGARETSVAMAADRSPVWPQGYVGSITHTDDLLGVAVARRTDLDRKSTRLNSSHVSI